MKRSLILVTVIGLMLALSSVGFGQSTPVKKKGKAKVVKPTNGLGGDNDLIEVKGTAGKQTANLSGEDDPGKTQRSSKTNKSKAKTTGFVSDTPAEVKGSKTAKSKVTAKSAKANTNAKMSKTGGVSTDAKPTNSKKPTNTAPDVDTAKAGSTNGVETQAKPPAVTNKTGMSKGESNVKNVWKYPTNPEQLVRWSENTGPGYGSLYAETGWEFAKTVNHGAVIHRKDAPNSIVADVTCSDSRYKLDAFSPYTPNDIDLVRCLPLEQGLPILRPTVTIRPEGN